MGLHQGSALSPFLFAIMIDTLTDEVRQKFPWTMMFADDIVICRGSKWKKAWGGRGMKMCQNKAEYVSEHE